MSATAILSALFRAAAALSSVTLCVAAPPLSAQTTNPTSSGEEVRFASDPGTVLAGTLQEPVGFGAGPFPVAVIIAGTGPWTRAGFVTDIVGAWLVRRLATASSDR